MIRKITLRFVFLLLLNSCLFADITLLGDASPKPDVNDGGFDMIKSTKHRVKQSPHWTVKSGKGNRKIGLTGGKMSSGGNAITYVESQILDNIPEYPKLISGDTLKWKFAADAQHESNATATFSLVFGDKVRVQANQMSIPGGDSVIEEFEGAYTITEEDVESGVMPFVRMTLRSEDYVNVHVYYVDLKVSDAETAGPRILRIRVLESGIKLKWSDRKGHESPENRYNVYRSASLKSGYKKIAEGLDAHEYLDESAVSGFTYYYLVTRVVDGRESSKSPVKIGRKLDSVAPFAPIDVKAFGGDAEVEIFWNSKDKDIASYDVYRGDAKGENLFKIADDIKKKTFDDFTPAKNTVNTYFVRATDFSGNESELSEKAETKVKAVLGASFRDLILPMPIHKSLSYDLWGTEGVVPRDPDNGIEDPDWSYWGGDPIKGKDGKYHMLVARWPESSTKGHWIWFASTVCHAVADKPTGPYIPTGETAYEWNKGRGHNPTITMLNDGTYMLHLLTGNVLTGPTMRGPWKYEGKMIVDYNGLESEPHNTNQYKANLSGIQREDGSLLFMTKWARIMISENGVLGPYVCQRKEIIFDKTIIPKKYLGIPYEDPVMWRDNVQYHMIINGFIHRRAIYLRSPDGLDWKFDPGVAYDPEVTRYEDGTKTSWFYLERPHVLQDELGRATHLSLAVMDVTKYADLASDNHSSKNIVIPLNVSRHIELLNQEEITKDTESIKIRIYSEEGFDAQKDIDLSSLRYGASEEVNFGRGCKIKSSEPEGEDLIVEFYGEGNGFTEKNFAGKVIGKTKEGKLLYGFSKLPDTKK